MNNLFFDLGLMIIIATIFAYLAKLLKQPFMLAYILTGVIIGPLLGVITNTTTIIIMSEIGIAFLLFIVGLEIDLKRLKNVGVIASIGGVIQILSLFSFGFIMAMILGFVTMEAAYIGIIIAFSSTMVVIKLLSDKKELDTLHGRIVVGILLVEDFFIILTLSVLTTLNDFSGWILILSLVKGLAVVAIAFLASKYFFPSIFRFAAKSPELLFTLSISVCFLFSMMFNYAGFSIVIGAFVAGITLANLPYNIEIVSRVKPLRDFFAIIFFISLGMTLLLSSINMIIKPLIILMLFILLIKPLITLFLCSFFGYNVRTGFQAAMALPQISEFSLIIAMQGLALGHIGKSIFSLTVILAIVTMTMTSYFIKYEDKLYLRIKKYIKFFGRFTEGEEELGYKIKKKKGHVVLCGYNRIGYSIARTLKKLKRNLLVVDFNPEIIKHLIKQKIHCMYGDIGDVEVLERLNLKYASMIISTIPTKNDNLLLIRKIKEVNKQALIFVTASHVEEALEFYDKGADYVILPHFLGGEHVSILIEEFTGNLNKIIETKFKHIKELKERHVLGHEHPRHH